MSEYPEHQKMRAVREQSQFIGQFIDWLQNETDLRICSYADDDGGYYLAHISTEKLLAQYLEIDLKRLEEEKCEMVAEMRKLNGHTDA